MKTFLISSEQWPHLIADEGRESRAPFAHERYGCVNSNASSVRIRAYTSSVTRAILTVQVIRRTPIRRLMITLSFHNAVDYSFVILSGRQRV
jgi:hypothetical protein